MSAYLDRLSCVIKMNHDKKWFESRVGGRIYRKKLSCKCASCQTEKVFVTDMLHAGYLYDCQNELEIEYYDECDFIKEQVNGL